MTTITRLKLLPRTAMKAKAATRLVGQVIAGDGINVTKEQGNYTVAWDSQGASWDGQPIGTDKGGTGQTSYTEGDLLYASSPSVLSRLAAGTSGYLLGANGAGVAPSYQGFLQSGAGAVTRTWQARLRDWVSVKDFGALGDGVTDDTPAIVNAISSTPWGGTLYFPPGTYSVQSVGSAIFTIDKPFTIRGAGAATNFKVHASVGNSTDLFAVVATGELRGVKFYDFVITNSAGNGRTWFALDSSGSGNRLAEVEIIGILAEAPDGYAVSIAGGTAGTAFHITINQNTFYGGGIYFDSAGDSIRVENNIFAGTKPALDIDQSGVGAGNLVIKGNNITTVAGSIIIRRSIGTLIIGNVFEQLETNTEANNAMIDVTGSVGLVESVRIIGNQIQSLAGYGNPNPIRIDNADSALVDGNRVYVGSAYSHVVVTAAAVNTLLTTENSWLSGSGAGGDLILTNASSSTAVTSKYTATPTTFGVLYGAGGTGTNTTGANTTTTRKFLRQVGDGTNSAAPAFDTLALGDLPAITPGILANISVGSAPPVSLGIATVMANVFGNANGMVLNTQGGNWTASTEINLGASGTLGSVTFGNASSGTVKIQPVTGALGTVTLSLPAATDTLVGKTTTDTLINKTFDTAGTGNSFSINGVAVTANTGTGAVARAASPTFTTPTLGAATATSVNGLTITSTTGTLTITNGKTLSLNNTLTFSGTDGSSIAFGAGGTIGPAGYASLGQIPGTATNDSASSGNIGQLVSSTVASGSAVALPNLTATNITSISLTAGDWDVWINGYIKTAAGTTVLNAALASISTTSATLDETPGNVGKRGDTVTYGGATYFSLPTAGPIRLSLASTTTVYFVAFADWTTTQPSGYGTIQARRRR